MEALSEVYHAVGVQRPQVSNFGSALPESHTSVAG